MRIRWLNVFAFLLSVTAIVVGLTHWGTIKACLSTVEKIGSRDPEAQVKGLIVVGLLGVVLVAIVRILVRNDRQDR